MVRFRHGLPGMLLAGLLVVVTGCAAPRSRQLTASPTSSPPALELADTPFFPQERYQCGPAALATVLAAAGAAATPEELTPQVYLPARKGSLQPELLAAVRRHGRVPYVLAPQLSALVAELTAGTPVLVLQNLGLSFAPVWHYAVVVGFDPARKQLILRSGTERRRMTRLSTFERTWRRSGYWAVAVTPPGRVPATAEEPPYLEAVLGLEQVADWEGAEAAYAGALARWPDSLGAHVGLGNSRYRLGDLTGAEAAFRAATLAHPESGIAFNNLAQTLADQGRQAEAEQAALRAVEIGGKYADTFAQTLAEIRAGQ